MADVELPRRGTQAEVLQIHRDYQDPKHIAAELVEHWSALPKLTDSAGDAIARAILVAAAHLIAEERYKSGNTQ